MANKFIKKVPLNKECLMEALAHKKLSIRKLDSIPEFGWSSRSITRGLKDQEVSPDLLDALGRFLNVEPDYLSGKYHNDLNKIEDPFLRSTLKESLTVSKFPYILKQQKEKFGENYLYDKYLEYILLIHDISLDQFNTLTIEQKKNFQIKLEESISPLIIEFFPINAKGKNSNPEIYRILNSIENYYDEDPTPPKEFFDETFSDRFDTN